MSEQRTSGATPRRRPVAPERAIQAAIMDYLRLSGWYVIRQQSGLLPNPTGRRVRFGVAGLPDLQAIKDGRSLFVEVKRPGERPTARQEACMADLTAHGALCVVATCIEDVERALCAADMSRHQ